MTCSTDCFKPTTLASLLTMGACCAFLFVNILIFNPNACFAEEHAGSNPTQVQGAKADSGNDFEYVLENRPDPFIPFITEKAAASTVDMNEIVDTSEPLSGMQLFEPGQLSLVALLKKERKNMAMVEDFTGKGYILLEGTKIGRRGMVKNITSNGVVIEETAVTRAGKEIITEIVMTLKKEGDE